mmetsp:Transcript_19481/g.53894  ORF Transcript_19481/g.53894 Transcript_19481/m.53894 type:complete len:225 (+) Transcript_19481:2-676(+)
MKRNIVAHMTEALDARTWWRETTALLLTAIAAPLLHRLLHLGWDFDLVFRYAVQLALRVLHRRPVDSVALVLLRAPLAVEDVPEVAPAIVAHDLVLAAVVLDPHVAAALLGVHYLVEARPAAAGLEFRVRGVQGVAAPSALEVAVLGDHLVVLGAAWAFRPLLSEDPVLGRPQLLQPLLFCLLHCVGLGRARGGAALGGHGSCAGRALTRAPVSRWPGRGGAEA